MKIIATITFCLLLVFHLAGQVYINEIDYDQPGTDAMEFIELVGPDGTSLNGYTIELVNGSNGSVYTTLDLSGLSIPNDNISGYGFFVIGPASGVANVDYTPSGWTTNQIQNGSPDGILLKLSGVVVDGFSYEGAMDALNSDFTPGMAISAAEDNNSPNLSVGRILLGFDANNQDQYFAQTAETPSPGEINTAHGQTLGGDPPPNIFNITRTPRIPDANQNTTVSADVTDNGLVNSVELRYIINGGTMQSVAMTNAGGDTWSADIPESAYNDADRVGFWIWAQDDASQTSESDTVNFFAGNTPIGDIHAIDSDGILLYNGYDARITGVATVATGIFQTTNIDVYVQDATGGINVFQFGLPISIVRGNSYTVIGSVDQFNGKAEIVPDDPTIDIIDNGPGTIPSMIVRAIAELLTDPETYEGMLIAILQVTNTGNLDPWPPQGSDANVEITDDGGTSLLTLRIDQDTNIDGSPEPNWPVNVAGIFGQFDNSVPYTEGYQLMPRSTDDIDVAVGIEPVAGLELPKNFRLDQNYPNPFNPETNIRYQLSNFGFVSLKVYDALGCEVTTLVNAPKAPGEYLVRWDASELSSGIYYVRMRVLDSGGVEQSFVKSRKIVLMK